MPKNDIKNKFKNQRKPTQEELDAMDNYNKPLKPQPAIMRYYPEKDYKPEAKPFPFYEDKDYKPEAKPFPFYEDETLKSKRKGGMMKKAKDMSAKHEGMESMADEAKETRLEKKGYVETKSGKMKKASLGLLIGVGADKALKSSEGARSLVKNLGVSGQLLGKYYDKKADSKDKTTGQVTAKQKGGSVKKAFIGGMFKKSATATASSDGGGGGDSSLMGLLGKSGLLKSFKNVTYSGDTSGQTTGGQQTKQVTAKRMGGMVRGGRAEIKGTRPAKLS